MNRLLIFFLLLLGACKTPSEVVQNSSERLLATIDEAKYDKIKEELKVSRISKPSKHLSGITDQPIAMGVNLMNNSNYSKTNCLYKQKGALQGCEGLVIEKEGDYVLVSSKEELVKVCGPVDSEEKAIAYIYLFTKAYPISDTSKKDGFIYYKTVEPTKITKKGKTYRVNLISYDQFGCGPHEYYTCTYEIDQNANQKLISKEKAFRDPEQDQLCVD